MSQRRFAVHIQTGGPWVFAEDHPAAVDGRTRYPKTVRRAGSDWVLKSGVNSKKIGAVVTKGKWRGMPIYTLTLEERATCPVTCRQWLNCYGNKMHWAQRFAAGLDLEVAIERDLAALSSAHPSGFVVRLHNLGDFYSAGYLEKWVRWVFLFPRLRVMGFSAWPPGTEIGDRLAEVREKLWDRFAVRQSGSLDDYGAGVFAGEAPPRGAIVCPAQSAKTECCATCGLCWSTKRPIAFMEH